ncbi:hypothetical protein Poli38472_013094 [Pythium oligandrum]|uniref:RanBP2-type domain-containing protein n=1 Tax=Pythium oligandrum TaxID=41045 RepID=A0A8K1C2E8_PYTOL|nr:hypothetical protein Poli38472_013094 [Pythium oligandrum]|eukprot:TMW55203.1 hypothetical protein Poli38472_013094 [Pythium oligandrum]
MGNSESRASERAGAEEGESSELRHSMPAAPAQEDTTTADTRANRRHSLAAPSGRRTSMRSRSATATARRNGDVEAGGIERGQQATEETTNQVGYWYLIKNGYMELVNLIIRPPRASYDVEELGPSRFTFSGRDYTRVDFTVVNDREQTLQCSHWHPVRKEVNGVTEFPCVIYLHGNSSCRVEALSILRTCLAAGVTVVSFDCAGSGKSDGEFISLGYYERDDLHAVIEHLRATEKVSSIGLWGRSMGAATALLHADRDPSIAGIVVDSAFTNLEQLVLEIVERGRREGLTIPGFLVKIVMKFIRSSVQKRVNFDIKKLSPIEHASISFIPALFVAAKGDDFIAPHHSEQIFAEYAGDKNIVQVAGDHNSVRPQFLLDSAGIFLQTALHVDPRLLPDADLIGNTRLGRTPWASGMSSAARLMMNLEAAIQRGPSAVEHVPKTPWACSSCTFVNAPLHLHCNICHSAYRPPESSERSESPSPPKRRSSSPSALVRSRLSDTSDDSLTSSAYSTSQSYPPTRKV